MHRHKRRKRIICSDNALMYSEDMAALVEN